MIDKTDWKILERLQANARTANAEIARQIGMAPSGVLERIRRLEQRGFIRGYEARVEPTRIGFGLVAFVFVRTAEPVRAKRCERRLASFPEALEVHHVAGEDCFLVKVRVRDTEELNHFLRKKLAQVKGVTATRTTIVLETVKETARLPLRRAFAGERA